MEHLASAPSRAAVLAPHFTPCIADALTLGPTQAHPQQPFSFVGAATDNLQSVAADMLRSSCAASRCAALQLARKVAVYLSLIHI